jgi:hypothetical protein
MARKKRQRARLNEIGRKRVDSTKSENLLETIDAANKLERIREVSITSENLPKAIATKFPVIGKQLQKSGSVYSVCGRFADFINHAIKTGDTSTLDQSMALAEAIYETADDTVRNAFYCDFCEVLDLRGELGMKAFHRMSYELQVLYMRAQKYIGRPFP